MAPGSAAAWALPAGYGAVAAAGLAWGLVIKVRRPDVYQAIGLGAHAASIRAGTATGDAAMTARRAARSRRRGSSGQARPTSRCSARSSPTRSSPSPPASG